MKPVTILLFLLTCIQTAHGQSSRRLDQEPDFPSIIKFNIISPVIGSLAFSYEKYLNKDASLLTTVNFLTGSGNPDFENIRGFGIAGEYRFYTGRKVMSGFYLQPYLRYQYFTDNKTKVDKLHAASTGLMFGHQTIFLKRLTFDVYYGPSYGYANYTHDHNKNYSDNVLLMFDGYWMRGGASLGFTF